MSATEVSYMDRSTSYAAQKGVTIMIERHSHEPGKPEYMFATGPDHPEYFPCDIDSFGNVCDENGIVVYPSKSGAHPLERGEHGYFGEFRENYAEGVHPELPSVRAMTIRAARTKAGITQQRLAELSGVNIRQIRRVESGESTVGNLTARNLLALADALGVDPHDLI